MKSLSNIWLLVWIISIFDPAIAAKREETIAVDMFVGEVRVLGHFDAERVAVGNGKLLRIESRGKGELIAIAEGKGSSSVRLWLSNGEQLNYNFRITESDPSTRVRMERVVRMSVKMVEVRKNALNELGINWASQLNGPALTTAGDFVSSSLFRSADNLGANLPLNVAPFSTHFGIATSIASQINLLASTGDATTLAEPTLSCINGGVASFLAGGELPYPVTGSNGQTSVEFKEYGIKLNIRPFADEEGNIYAKILTEISQIDSAVTVLGAPGILTRRTETEMNVAAGQTIVLSGLLSAESSEDINKVPGLGDIPYIGTLFRSKKYRNQKTELVIFVTPEVVMPYRQVLSEQEQKIHTYGKKHMDSVDKALNFYIMD